MKVSIKYISKKQPKQGSFFHHHIVNVRISMFEDFETNLQRLDIYRHGSQIDLFRCCMIFSSASSVPPYLANYIFLDPKAFPGLYDKWIGASDFLKGVEVEVRHLLPRKVEVLANCRVPVVPGCPPVLSAPDSAGSCSPHLTHILGRSSQAWSCLV